MNDQSFEAVIKYSESAIRGAFLLNGGACIALLAFIGNLDSTDLVASSEATFSTSLQLFAYGALMAVLTSACSYISQSCWSAQHVKSFYIIRLLAIAIYFISIGLVICGINIVSESFKSVGI